MYKIFNTASVVTGLLGGLCAAVFGAWDKLIWALLILMILDYITGVIKGIYTKKLSSEMGYKGLLKKAAILIIVALANVVEGLIGENIAIREIVIMFYAANEGISILENAAVILPNMPQRLKDVLLQLRGDTEDK